eukprot:scaffold4013_cov192-Ochromonas_danica.AAC.10
MIRLLLASYLSSIHDLEFLSQDISEESVDEILTILYEKTTPLKKLCLQVDQIALYYKYTLSRFLYSGAAMHLEVLSIKTDSVVDKEDLFSYLSKACPRLRTLILKAYSRGIDQAFDVFPTRSLLELCQSCPKLITVRCLDESIYIEVDEYMRLDYEIFPLDSIVEKELFMECLCLTIQRSQCKLPVPNYFKEQDDQILFKSAVRISH